MIEFAPDADGQRTQLRGERAARGEPSLGELEEWLIVGTRLEAAGFGEGAAEAFRRALAVDRRVPQAHLGLGRSLLDLEDGPGAAAAFRRAAEMDLSAAENGVEALLDDPDEDPSWGLGLAEHLSGRFTEALAAYGRCVERFPEFAEPHLEMARCHGALGDMAAAAAACRRALETAPRRPRFREEAEALLEVITRAG